MFGIFIYFWDRIFMAAIRCYVVDMMKLVTKSPTYRRGKIV